MSVLTVVRPESVALASLLESCAAGDRAAFRSLYDREAPRLHGLALRLTRQPALAADVVHDTLLQVWQRAARFDPSRGSAEAWIGTLLRYRAIDALRRHNREDTTDEPLELVDEAPDPLDLLASRDDAASLRRCLGTLDPVPRRAVTLAFVDGLSHSELAARLDAPLGTVKSWVRRALRSLRDCLGR